MHSQTIYDGTLAITYLAVRLSAAAVPQRAIAHLAGFVVDDGIDERQHCNLQVCGVLVLIQTARKVYNQRLQGISVRYHSAVSLFFTHIANCILRMRNSRAVNHPIVPENVFFPLQTSESVPWP